MLDEGQQALAARSDYNFDHPDAFDFELLVSVLRKLKKGKSVKVPVYDFTTHSRRREWVGAAGPGWAWVTESRERRAPLGAAGPGMLKEGGGWGSSGVWDSFWGGCG